MKLVSKALESKDLEIEDLPEPLQLEVEKLQDVITKYNEACEEYDEEAEGAEEDNKELDEMLAYIETSEVSIAQKIEQIRVAAPAPAPAAPVEKKESNSLGWWIFGGVALVLTVGAVNVFKNK